MRRVYLFCAVVALLLCSAAGVRWKRVYVESSGVGNGEAIYLPYTWDIIADSSHIIENAYGQGVSCKSLLTAQEGDSSLSILTYWPAPNKKPDEIARDIDGAIGGNISSSASLSDMKIGDIRASSLTSKADSSNNRKVTAFIHGGKIYCLILNYPISQEYSTITLVRNIISRWRF